MTTEKSHFEIAEERIAQAKRKESSALDLSGNQLGTWPESLGQLTQLQRLDLRRNQLSTLPEWLGQLFQLQELDLSDNQLSALPESLGQLTQLRTLDLRSNRLIALPESLGRLTQLQWLYLYRNPLIAVPEWLGQLTQLQELDLSDNQLTTVPESLGRLTQLQGLYLGGTRLSRLPEWLGQLTQLRRLSLSGNRLSTLPDWMGQLTQLQWLYLHHNQLSMLPEWLDELTQLQGLYLSGNQLSTLPESLCRLENLERLFLHGNDGLGVPAEVLGPTWEDVAARNKPPAKPAEILDYYFATRGAQGRALRELKLIVVGRGGAGKTSLIKRLNGQPLDRQESETHGIVISPLELACADGPVTARIWDFGGQHVLHAMHEFFLTARSLYLLVLGERDDMSERDAAYWLQLIRGYAGAAPVVVALNKSAGRPRDMDRATLEKNYGPILAWVATECDETVPGSDASIARLRDALTSAADRMSEVRKPFPAKWWAIKEWLEGMNEPYLDFAVYQKRCGELGEGDGTQQETLAAWMHDLGVALNYARDPRLHDTTVLRPDWLANGICAMLRANDPRHPTRLAHAAMLTPDMLGRIYAASERLGMLKAVEYPADKWPFLLRLMTLFQLAYPLDEQGGKLLVPALLPVEPPAGCDEPDDREGTRLRYEFAVVPGPLIPRLLVRTFSLIDGERRWRRGAILRYATARARVWATQDERWVHATAIGPNADRNELLTMIRGTLAELLTEYRNLPVVEQWEHDGQWVPRRTLEKMGVLPAEEAEVEVEP